MSARGEIPIFFTEGGNVIDLKAVIVNANAPISSTELPMVIDFNLIAPANAISSIFLTELGILILVIPKLGEKASSKITVTLLSITTSPTQDLPFSKSPTGINTVYVTPGPQEIFNSSTAPTADGIEKFIKRVDINIPRRILAGVFTTASIDCEYQ